MGRKKKEGVFTFVLPKVKGQELLDGGYKVDDIGNPILKHRLYKVAINRAFKTITLSTNGTKRDTAVKS